MIFSNNRNDIVIYIKPENEQLRAKAHELALKLGAIVIVEENLPASTNAITIFLNENGISLQKTGKTNENPVFIDFSSSQMQYRLQNSSLRTEAIARAVGLKSNKGITILDTTAGLGGDSFILAAMGANMLMLERNPLIHLLLDDAIMRTHQDAKLKEITARMQLIEADAITFLDNIDINPPIIYMDPMFPAKTKTALNKKEMRLFHDITGGDHDVDALLTKALTKAQNRVVVKRPLHAPYIHNRKPHFNISGKSSRFDVYMI